MKTLANKSAVFTTAWNLLREGKYQTLSEALKFSWSVERVRKQLGSSIVKFSFTKVNGELREATGTRDLNIIPENDRPKGEYNEQDSKTDNQKAVTFYDLDKGAWRSFKRETLLTKKTA